MAQHRRNDQRYEWVKAIATNIIDPPTRTWSLIVPASAAVVSTVAVFVAGRNSTGYNE